MKNNKVVRAILIGVIIAAVLNFIKLPYYVTKPGMATELEPIIEVDGGYEEEGSFSLTTVGFGRANIFSYTLANILPYHELLPLEDVVQEGESDDDYLNRQMHMMESSQESAVSLAYEKAGKKVDYKFHGIYVMQVVDGMPSEGKLKAGDRIFKVDGKEFKTAEEFIAYVGQKKKGDKINVTYDRNGKEGKTEITASEFPDNKKKVGIGISLVTDRELITDPEISLDTNNIGGPSAGLMMTLEIYNQLTKEDYTKGYNIAGTGTIDENGTVGPIGGISQKIVAADKSGAEIFFAPNQNGIAASNYKEAVATAKDIETDMKIVPIDTFDDAVDYLKTLKEK
ncbi:PDZ domain-containing protein [Bacillus sp. OVS6]|uniref:SepM family pheromone-processing serine protease n=1 Tax=Metabacillus dongyingensis TaxID=2874282 RepID=UPI001CBC30E3|nr:SepM family pheromone-processing serine protease [Metabacillus dongyingensis]UAL54140.1 PDZ domain-containing protein [Metabacillus dongyingensis]UOK59472.1 PDZ domain-containing protein [Bacillus sp. OVS6]